MDIDSSMNERPSDFYCRVFGLDREEFYKVGNCSEHGWVSAIGTIVDKRFQIACYVFWVDRRFKGVGNCCEHEFRTSVLMLDI
jgi:hypothetical protein